LELVARSESPAVWSDAPEPIAVELLGDIRRRPGGTETHAESPPFRVSAQSPVLRECAIVRANLLDAAEEAGDVETLSWVLAQEA
jgi:hypothetical protein